MKPGGNDARIGHEQLKAALGVLVDGALTIEETVDVLGVDDVELKACLSSVADWRKPAVAPDKLTAYQGGILDGFMLGVAAARQQ